MDKEINRAYAVDQRRTAKMYSEMIERLKTESVPYTDICDLLDFSAYLSSADWLEICEMGLRMANRKAAEAERLA